MKNKKLIIIIILLSILLLISIITNIILLTKLNTNKTDNNVSDTTTETDTKSDLIGVYYNESKGKIEFKDENTFICQYNTEYTYNVEGKDIIFTYYINLSKDENGKCIASDDKGNLVEVASCKQKQTKKGKIVNNGVIWENKLFYKIG